MIKVGDRLENGSMVLAIKKKTNKGEIILCWWQGEYVSWLIGKDGIYPWAFCHGQNFKQAVKEFEDL